MKDRTRNARRLRVVDRSEYQECPACEGVGIAPTTRICDSCVVEAGLHECAGGGDDRDHALVGGWEDGDLVSCVLCGAASRARCDEGRVRFLAVESEASRGG